MLAEVVVVFGCCFCEGMKFSVDCADTAKLRWQCYKSIRFLIENIDVMNFVH